MSWGKGNNYDQEPENQEADAALGAAITKYAWSAGKKTVSVFVEVEGLDEMADDKVVAAREGELEASLTVFGIGNPPFTRRLKLKRAERRHLRGYGQQETGQGCRGTPVDQEAGECVAQPVVEGRRWRRRGWRDLRHGWFARYRTAASVAASAQK